jgi:flagellar biosynthesis protein FliQ
VLFYAVFGDVDALTQHRQSVSAAVTVHKQVLSNFCPALVEAAEVKIITRKWVSTAFRQYITALL